MVATNIWIAASDGNTEQVLSFLQESPMAVNSKDQNGYTPIHACVSYNHTDLLRQLVTHYGGDVNVTDDDGDTPLFTCESVEMARLLVDELNADWTIKNDEGLMAADSIEEDGQYPLIVGYLRSLEETPSSIPTTLKDPGSPPDGIDLDIRAVPEDTLPPVDEEFRRRIEELAARGDFNSPGAQENLRNLVLNAVQQHVFDDSIEDRNVRSRN